MVLSSRGELIPQTSGLGLVEMGAGLIKADVEECALGGGTAEMVVCTHIKAVSD